MLQQPGGEPHESAGSEASTNGAVDDRAGRREAPRAVGDPHEGGGLVTFVDSRGVVWTVREITRPAISVLSDASLAKPEFKEGWLLFESDEGKCRLAPYPADWQLLAGAELEHWLRQAQGM